MTGHDRGDGGFADRRRKAGACDGVEEWRERGRAGCRIRTDDLLITNQLLCQLSYPAPRQRLRRATGAPTVAARDRGCRGRRSTTRRARASECARRSRSDRREAREAAAFGTEDEHQRAIGEREIVDGHVAALVEPDRPDVGACRLDDHRGDAGGRGDREVLDRARGGLRDGGSDARGAMPRAARLRSRPRSRRSARSRRGSAGP